MQDKCKLYFVPAETVVVRITDNVLCGSGIMGKLDLFGENYNDGEVHE